MLAIVRSLNELRTIIWKVKVIIHSDNRNLSFDVPATKNRVQRWKLALSEMEYKITHITGCINNAADSMSRNFSITPSFQHFSLPIIITGQQAVPLSNTNNNNINEKKESQLSIKSVGHLQVQVNDRERYIIPPSIQALLIKELYMELLHPGISKLYSSINQYLNIPKLKDKLQTLTNNCIECQQNKNTTMNQGTLVGFLHSEKVMKNICSDMYGPVQLDLYGSFGKAWIISFYRPTLSVYRSPSSGYNHQLRRIQSIRRLLDHEVWHTKVYTYR